MNIILIQIIHIKHETCYLGQNIKQQLIEQRQIVTKSVTTEANFCQITLFLIKD